MKNKILLLIVSSALGGCVVYDQYPAPVNYSTYPVYRYNYHYYNNTPNYYSTPNYYNIPRHYHYNNPGGVYNTPIRPICR